MGNEASDADSLVSALALSYMYTHLPEPKKAVALLQREEGAPSSIARPSSPCRPQS